MKLTNHQLFTLSTALLLGTSCQQNSLPRVAERTRAIAAAAPCDVPLPKAPHGVFINSANHPYLDKQQEAVRKFIIADPTNDGANLVIPWAKCDLGNGNYDWSYVEKCAKPWWDANKKVNLLIWTAVEVTRQQVNGENMTPAYVRQKVTMIPVTYPEGDFEIAAVWNDYHRSEYKKFIKAVIERFQDEPRIGFMRFGFGVGAENYPTNKLTADSPNRVKFNEAGFSFEVWRNHVFSMMDYVASLKSRKYINMTMNDVIGDPTYYKDFMERAVGHGFGIGMQGLVATGEPAYKAGKRCYADWCNVYPALRGKVALEAQTASGSSPDSSTRQGPLKSQVNFAIRQGVQILELYPVEWFIANNPNNPFHAKYGEEYRATLKDIHQRLNCVN
jgi:hypothetical protein